MRTMVTGEATVVCAALHDACVRAAATGQVVMTVTLSNACPVEGRIPSAAPATMHGADMPGLAALQAGARHIDMQYTPLPDGAQIRYTTQDPALIKALHQWFAAQLSDHGHHAVGHHEMESVTSPRPGQRD